MLFRVVSRRLMAGTSAPPDGPVQVELRTNSDKLDSLVQTHLLKYSVSSVVWPVACTGEVKTGPPVRFCVVPQSTPQRVAGIALAAGQCSPPPAVAAQ